MKQLFRFGAGLLLVLAASASYAPAAHQRRLGPKPTVAPTPAHRNVIVLEDDGTLLRAPNAFQFPSGFSIRFTPAGGAAYAVATGGVEFRDGGAAVKAFEPPDTGTPYARDDGYVAVRFPTGSPFPFYGKRYDTAYVSVNGLITFAAPDPASPPLPSAAVLGRTQPRIAPFWSDLDAEVSDVLVAQDAGETTVTWRNVSAARTRSANTFQARLHADGRIDFVYKDLYDTPDVVGIGPGGPSADVSRVHFAALADAKPHAGAIAEAFGTAESIDVQAVAQAFYRSHPDDVDFLYVMTDAPRSMTGESFAYYLPVSNREWPSREFVKGINVGPLDYAAQYDSSRLQGFIDMGTPGQYPDDLSAPIGGIVGISTSLSIFAHETGHRWSAYVNYLEGGERRDLLLGRDVKHWSFFFNSESTKSQSGAVFSSSLEGNAIVDNGDGTYATRETAVGYYCPLDLYLMGLRKPSEVPDTFLLTKGKGAAQDRGPARGTKIRGTRRVISVRDIVAAEGPRLPDADHSQKRFRGAWILVAHKGAVPTDLVLDKLERFRSAAEAYWNDAVEGKATLSTETAPAAKSTGARRPQ